jgi:sensor histidine kinase YesM
MKNIITKSKNWKLAILFSAILSLLGVLANILSFSDFHITLVLSSWIVAFSFLLIGWYLNSRITKLFIVNSNGWNLLSKILVILLANSVLLALFILAGVFVSGNLQPGREYNYPFMVVRGAVSIAMIYLIQYSLNLRDRTQLVLLQNQMLKTENIRAKFETLKQQISPHFLFNALSTLRSMIRSSNSSAEEFVIKLSDIYRAVLANKERETVTLKEELELINQYSFLLFSRYENMLHISIDIPEDFMGFRIPTFTLQLLLENSVKHNIVSRERPLHIRIYDSGLANLTVENNLQRKLSVDEESGYGLQNLVKRYDLLGITDGILVFSDESVFRVKVKLLDT